MLYQLSYTPRRGADPYMGSRAGAQARSDRLAHAGLTPLPREAPPADAAAPTLTHTSAVAVRQP